MQTGLTYAQVRAISDYVEELNRLERCISFWECRIVRGWRYPFYLTHNIHCAFKADGYRRKVKALNLSLTPKLRLVK